jgi:formimidoylglutamate deiminase
MADLHFETALVDGRWARGVRVEVSDDGVIRAVAEGVSAPRSETIGGVALPGVPNVHSHAFQRATRSGGGESGCTRSSSG